MMSLLEVHLGTWLRETRLTGSAEAVKQGRVALTFDDGPHARYTTEVLRILGDYNCQATFFWIATHAQQLARENAIRFRDIVNVIQKNGHEIGLHGFSDYVPTVSTRLFGKSSREEMRRAKEVLEYLSGTSLRFYRPHYLHLGPEVVYARELGLTPVLFEPFHYARADEPQEQQVRRFSGAQPGNILLFHDGTTLRRSKTYVTEVLPPVLENLRQRGLSSSSLSHILS